jgi:hypothetical protein
MLAQAELQVGAQQPVLLHQQLLETRQLQQQHNRLQEH